MRSKSLFVIAVSVLVSISGLQAQKYFTKQGRVKFFSETPIESIEAKSNTASSVIDIASGKLQFAVLIKSFQFEKALMQEHFNENYMESKKFPKAIFKGKILDKEALNFEEDGVYSTNVEGMLTVHGVVQEVKLPAVFTVNRGSISAKSVFPVTPQQFEIEIPNVVKDKIAKSIDVTVEADYKPL